MVRTTSANDATPGFMGLQKRHQQEDERKDSGQHELNDGHWQPPTLSVRPNSGCLESILKRLRRQHESQQPEQQSAQHAVLTPGRPGTSWHRSHRGSYMSSPPGRTTGLVHGAGSPLISRWVRVAISPHLAHTAFSMVTESAAALR